MKNIWQYSSSEVTILPFIYRPAITIGESLSSYIHRTSKENYVSVHELWRLIAREGAHYPQASISSNIDIYPYNLIDINQLADLLNTNSAGLDALTFIPVYENLGIAKDYIPNSRALSGSISTYRRYCPECLRYNKFYKLIWQVNELQYCSEHNTVLLNKCYNCNKSIPILPNVNELGICPYCNFNLTCSAN